MSTPAEAAVDAAIQALQLVKETLSHQPTGRMELVAWRERDDDKWIYYTPEDDPDVFKHITLHQKPYHGVSVFAVYQDAVALQAPATADGSDA